MDIVADGNEFGTYEVDYNPLGFSINLADIQLDGMLNIALSVIRGDLIFKNSTLVVSAIRVSVPEPGPLSLFGLRLVGLYFA